MGDPIQPANSLPPESVPPVEGAEPPVEGVEAEPSEGAEPATESAEEAEAPSQVIITPKYQQQMIETPSTDQIIPQIMEPQLAEEPAPPVPPPPPPPPVEKDVYIELDPNRHVYVFGLEEQNNVEPYFQGAYRGLAITSRSPGRRLPGKNLGVSFAEEAMMREMIPEELLLYLEGMIGNGDYADVGSIEEIAAFFYTLEKLKRADPIYRVLALMVGNHDCFHAGTAKSGTNFFGGLGLVLNLQGQRSYGKDIHGPEVGGQENRLDKEKFIQLLYEYFFNKKPDEMGEIRLAKASGSRYTLEGEKGKKWSDTNQVFKDFWRQEGDGSWNLLIKYKPEKEKAPEKQWIYASAAKLADLESEEEGTYPVYFLGLDTMDYLQSGTGFGSLQGHISSYQIKAAKAFIEKMKALNPNAKFVVGGHHDVTSIVEAKSSGLLALLEDSSILTYIAGHKHKRDFVDLSDKEHLKSLSRKLARSSHVDREEPLPQILVPSIIDYPNEFVLLDLGINPEDPDKIYFEYSFTGIDPSKIAGRSPEVDAELEYIRPYLLTFDDAVEHIDDPQLQEFATPGTPLKRQIYLTFDLDEGVLTRPGKAHDLLVAQDTIRAMVEDAQLDIRLFTSVVKLTLLEAGLTEEAYAFEKIYLERLEHLNGYYEDISRGDYTPLGHYHDDHHGMSDQIRELDELTYLLLDILSGEKDGSNPINSDNQILLDSIAPILVALKKFVGDYDHWLQDYEELLRAESEDSEMIKITKLSGSDSFRALLSHRQGIPYGSYAHAFMAGQFVESSLQEVQYYKGTLDERDPSAIIKDVPDVIRLEYSMSTGEVTLTPDPPPALTEEEKDERREAFGDPPRGPDQPPLPNPDEIDESDSSSRNQPAGHFSLRVGHYWGKGKSTFDMASEDPLTLNGGNNGWSLDAGGQFHLLNQQGAPRLNARSGVSWNLDSQSRIWETDTGNTRRFRTGNNEFAYTQTLTIGDRMGLFEIGPTGRAGLALKEPVPVNLAGRESSLYAVPLVGAGGQITLFEGVATLDGGYKWYFNDPTQLQSGAWYLGVTTDLATLIRLRSPF